MRLWLSSNEIGVLLAELDAAQAENQSLRSDVAWLVDRTNYWSALGQDDTEAEKVAAVRQAREGQ